MQPEFATLVQLKDALAGKKLSAVEAVSAYLERIGQYDGVIHAFNELYGDYAMQRAAQVDAGQITGKLAGVPIAIKDNLCTPYGHTTCSSKMLANFKAPYMATAVQKLEDEGAIILGKTNLDEFAMGSSTENSAFGMTKNPWDTTRVPGGSSGGSAASMAADFAAASLGSDTGGSIRQPAALCGVCGLKPTYGKISRYGLIAFASSLDQIGPFTRSVEDAALLMDVMCGHDPKDSTSANIAPADHSLQLHKPVENLRIGIAKQYMSDANEPAVAKAVANAIEVYKSMGATIVEVDLPHTEYGIPVYYIVATAEASSNLARYDGVHYGHRTANPKDLYDLYAASRAEGFGDEVKRRIMLGTYALCSGYYDAYYNRALKVRRLIKQDFDKAYEQCDAILCPTTTGVAFKAGDKTDDPLAMYLNDVYTVNANLAGIPGMTIPAGLSDEGLPVSIQLYGNVYEDAKLLRIAQMFQAATDFHQLRPTLD
jgi:aspartyl-tRNA(Asn)/glutamyl-tRNA(Gln) amidotransferase subunit A